MCETWGDGARHIRATDIHTLKWKAEEVIENLLEGRLSRSSGPPVVAKFSNRRGYLLVDGHHRIVEEYPLDRVWVRVEDWKWAALVDDSYLNIKEFRNVAEALGFVRQTPLAVEV